MTFSNKHGWSDMWLRIGLLLYYLFVLCFGLSREVAAQDRRGRSMVPRPGFALLPCAHPCASNRQGDDLAGDIAVSLRESQVTIRACGIQ